MKFGVVMRTDVPISSIADLAQEAEAHRRSVDQALPVEFAHGDAHALPFAEETSDRCRADRVFQYLQQPHLALQELVRTEG